MTSSSAPARPRAHGGFTLLEVMCALAILALITSLIARLCHQAFEQGEQAADLRDLREAADTVFRRLVYEDGRHSDGLRASLEDFYAGWAELPSMERDRWRPYVMEFRRRPRTAAGQAGATGAEPLDGGSSSSRTGGTSGSTGSSGSTGTPGGTGGTGSAAGGTDEEQEGVELMQLTLTIWHEDEANEHLIVLQTLITPHSDGSTTGGSTPGGTR